ncbi:hypothetical protein [Hoeflea halophila]|uniref:hypothetical protein n=1 Tax=Hoeflea halophila TaxID=714899 RepID=UPI001179AAFF|nr:hypothetical protein [Hoeflea halophila]
MSEVQGASDFVGAFLENRLDTGLLAVSLPGPIAGSGFSLAGLVTASGLGWSAGGIPVLLGSCSPAEV